MFGFLLITIKSIYIAAHAMFEFNSIDFFTRPLCSKIIVHLIAAEEKNNCSLKGLDGTCHRIVINLWNSQADKPVFVWQIWTLCILKSQVQVFGCLFCIQSWTCNLIIPCLLCLNHPPSLHFTRSFICIPHNSHSLFRSLPLKIEKTKAVITLWLTNIAGWKMDPDWADVFPIEDGDIPASYVIVYQRLIQIGDTVDGSEIRRSPPGMYKKPCKSWDFLLNMGHIPAILVTTWVSLCGWPSHGLVVVVGWRWTSDFRFEGDG